MKPIIKLSADEIQHYKNLFKDSLIAYAQLQCDKDPIGEGVLFHIVLCNTSHILLWCKYTGAFGKVYKGLLTQAGNSVEHVAIKTIKS